MFKNYIVIAFRNLKSHKSFSAINIIGLSIGMAICLFIMQYISYEKSYDKFHENSENIYRVQYNIIRDGEKIVECAAAVPAVGPAMKDNFPEVVEFARAFPVDGTMSYNKTSFREGRIQIATPSFIKMLTFPLIKGDPDTALEGPFKAVLTESAAKRYFGDEDPIGKTVKWNGEAEFEITGVCKDVPSNSHIKFTFLFSFETLVKFAGESAETAWGWYDFNTYVELVPGTDHKEFDKKFHAWLENEMREDWEKYNSSLEFPLQPIEDIHLKSDLLQESEPGENGDSQAVTFLLIIALIVLIIAWVNYINLSTSKSLTRAKEVGIRKVSGANRTLLIRQFLLESIGINLVSFLLAIMIVIFAKPIFNSLTGIDLSIVSLLGSGYWIILGIVFLLGSLLSGLYPAFVMSSFKPVTVLKGSFQHSSSGSILRKILVIIQFAVSVTLIASTMIVYQQLKYMRNKSLGVDIDQTLIIHAPRIAEKDSLFVNNYEAFRNEILRNSSIQSFTGSTNIPGVEIFWGQGSRRADAPPEDSQVMYIVGMDYDYIPSYDLKIIAGRNYSPEIASDDSAMVINKAALKFYGYNTPEEAIGGEIIWRGDQKATIIGVIENYNQMSLRTNIKPLIFPLVKHNDGFLSLKISTHNIDKTISFIKQKWDTFFEGNPYDYFFLDEFFDRQYNKDKQFGEVFGVFTMLAIFIAALGLFALASYSSEQRTKEIGIRKVMGASVKTIVVLLVQDFVKLVIIANVIAIYPTWFFMNKWLQNFAYQINFNWFALFLSGLLVLITALFTVGYKTLKTATANPADALKYE